MDKYIEIQKANYINLKKGISESSKILLKNVGGNYLIHEGDIDRDKESAVSKYKGLGEYICPGFVDIQCSIADYTRPDFSISWNELLCAHKGGYTTVCPTPVWDKFFDKKDNIKVYLKEIKRYKGIEIIPCLPVPKRRNADKTWGFAFLAELGVRVISDGGKYLSNDVMREVMAECAANDMLFICSTHDPALIQDGCVNSPMMAKHLKVGVIPSSPELCAIARGIIFSAETGCRVHFTNVSLARSCEMIKNAKSAGVKVSASTAPQYFTCDENEVLYRGAKAKLYPPLRKTEDVEAVRLAIGSGVIDCISTDNTPLPPGHKADLASAKFGSVGFETAFSASYTGLVATGVISIFRLIDAMSVMPRRILFGDCGMPDSNGYIAIDPDAKHFYSKNSVKSNCWNSVFDGRDLRGVVKRNFNQLS